MLRELTQNEWAAISGAGYVEEIVFYPNIPFDSVLVGWVQQTQWEEYSWKESAGLFSEIQYVKQVAIVDTQPIFAPKYY